MNCTKCNGLLAKDWLSEGPDTIRCMKCINCGKYYYNRATPEEIAKHPEPQERKEVARDIGDVTNERVRQIECRALDKLRKAIKKICIEPDDCNGQYNPNIHATLGGVVFQETGIRRLPKI